MAAKLHHKEIRNRAHAFIQQWSEETREEAEAKSFWDAFFTIFGINRKDVALFEFAVEKLDKKHGFIDLFWKGTLLVEHKSRGKSLDKAQSQAFEYYFGLPEKDKPNYILLSDFEQFRLYDLTRKKHTEFKLIELPDYLHLFDFMSGLQYYGDEAQTALNIQAAELLGSLHDALAASGYEGHELEIFLVRILFCLFAEDTGIFQHHQFIHYLLNFTKEDGSDTSLHLNSLFQVLDTAPNKRNKHLTQELNDFPYVNGHLFSERLDMPYFDMAMRGVLLDCAHFDWSSISPAIFGSLFQSIMNKEARRNLGAHYTSEQHILRLIRPLFLDDLYVEFDEIVKAKQANVKQQKLIEFQKKLTALQFLDPACGCGNFLIITYRELRRLELAVLYAQYGDKLGSTHMGGLAITIEPAIKLEHFHGIEIEEWPARIAEVAMWLTQHQMNREFAKQFGREPDLLPLRSAAHIVQGNSLQLDWNEIVNKEELAYIVGNPPFVGKAFRTASQNQDTDKILGKVKNYKNLDYVACWFYKAASYIKSTSIKVALVSTNSITQGEQVPILWGALLELGANISFAHRTFAWDSEARGKAAVHVVIIGFSCKNSGTIKLLYDYPEINGDPIVRTVDQINPYLIDAPNALMDSRTKPLCNVPEMVFGNMPNDGGNLLLTTEEKESLIKTEPDAVKWVRLCLGAEEFINGKERWCLWLVGVKPNELKALPQVLKRVEATKTYRLASTREATRKLADKPYLFGENRHPEGNYILVPSVSSERRDYIPMGFFDSNTISSNLNLMIPNATLYEFGVLESNMHMAWMRTVCGRLKSDYRYSAKLVYNNFPWPDPDSKHHQKIEKAAQAVLDARALYPESTLADLYDPLTMPPELTKAHKTLDKAVEQAYRKEKFTDDLERLRFLFERYQQLNKA